MSQVISQGLKSGLLITQGYSVNAISIVVTPPGDTVLTSAVITLTSSVAANWSATGGTLVVAGDNLSATWTAPGSPGSFTFTATDQTDPGNTLTYGLLVVSEFGMVPGMAGIQQLGLGVGRAF